MKRRKKRKKELLKAQLLQSVAVRRREGGSIGLEKVIYHGGVSKVPMCVEEGEDEEEVFGRFVRLFPEIDRAGKLRKKDSLFSLSLSSPLA